MVTDMQLYSQFFQTPKMRQLSLKESVIFANKTTLFLGMCNIFFSLYYRGQNHPSQAFEIIISFIIDQHVMSGQLLKEIMPPILRIGSQIFPFPYDLIGELYQFAMAITAATTSMGDRKHFIWLAQLCGGNPIDTLSQGS